MLPATTSPTCEQCGQEASYCDSIPDARIPGTHPSECGYRLQPLCWLHAAERRQVATSRVRDLVVLDGVGHLDLDRRSGDCVCDVCGRIYHKHPRHRSATFMTVLCDGSLVKL
jgi:hypothetical protein